MPRDGSIVADVASQTARQAFDAHAWLEHAETMGSRYHLQIFRVVRNGLRGELRRLNEEFCDEPAGATPAQMLAWWRQKRIDLKLHQSAIENALISEDRFEVIAEPSSTNTTPGAL